MAADSDVLSEIEVLKSIYLDELSVSQNAAGNVDVSIELHPSTAQDSLSQFVRLTLSLSLDTEYPSSPPSISIHHPRGLSDDMLFSVQRCLQTEARSCLGGPALYQLIEKAKEILTESNIPHGNCVICLYDFKEEEVFTKTSCYHYFHSYCLGRYIAHSETEIREREKEMEEDKTKGRVDGQELTVVCPVCREPLTYNLDVLLTCPAPHFPSVEDTVVGAEFRKKWAELQTVLERQKERGGIIDPEAESNRFLIRINETSPENSMTSPALVTPTSQVVPSSLHASQLSGPCSFQAYSQSNRRGGPGRKWHVRPKQSSRIESQPQREMPCDITEQLDKLTISSGQNSGFRECAAGLDELPLDMRQLGNSNNLEEKIEPNLSDNTDSEACQNVCLSKTTLPRKEQSISQSNMTGNQMDSGTPETNRGQRWDRGRRNGPAEERFFKRADQWETYRERGQRGRGGFHPPYRGRGGARGARRGFHHSGAEQMGNCDKSSLKKNEMYLHASSQNKPAP